MLLGNVCIGENNDFQATATRLAARTSDFAFDRTVNTASLNQFVVIQRDALIFLITALVAVFNTNLVAVLVADLVPV